MSPSRTRPRIHLNADLESVVDTGAPVSPRYTPPFAYTGAIDRIEIEIGESDLDPEEEARIHARFDAGKEY